MRLISVVLGSPTIKAREDASAALLNYGFTFYETVKLQDAGKPRADAACVQGQRRIRGRGQPARHQRDHRARPGRNAHQGSDDQRSADRAAGAQCQGGRIHGERGDEVVARVPLVTLAKVDEGGIWRTAVDTVKLWFE